MTFRIGQKIVCVNASVAPVHIPAHMTGRRIIGDLDGLSEGSVYTVAAITDWFGYPVVVLSEIRRKVVSLNHCPGFGPPRFRPVVDRKFDLSVFTRLLDTERAPA